MGNRRSRTHQFQHTVCVLVAAKFKVGSDGQGGKAVKREDLDKMHTYRDAILGTNTVWVLYPDDHEQTPLFYPAGVDSSLSGVGAVALTPNVDAGLRDVIGRVLEPSAKKDCADEWMSK